MICSSCGEMAIALVGEDGLPMCLNCYAGELAAAKETVSIAAAAVIAAERRVRVRWVPIETLDTGGAL